MLHRAPGNAEGGYLVSVVLSEGMIERLSENVLRMGRQVLSNRRRKRVVTRIGHGREGRWTWRTRVSRDQCNLGLVPRSSSAAYWAALAPRHILTRCALVSLLAPRARATFDSTSS